MHVGGKDAGVEIRIIPLSMVSKDLYGKTTSRWFWAASAERAEKCDGQGGRRPAGGGERDGLLSCETWRPALHNRREYVADGSMWQTVD